ncbi:MAG: GyrI-like domain-containing protein [Phycisphaerae bacterium]
MNQPARSTTRSDYQKRILRVLVHVQTHLDECLPLEDLASVAHFSPFHFHRIFRGLVGESVQGHIRRLRLERAAHRLKFTGEPVTRIAFEAGYETHEAFTRAFRALLDASPSEFRKQQRAMPFKKAPSGVHFSPDGALDHCQLPEKEDPPMEVRIETLAPMPVLFARHTGPYDQVGKTWNRLFAWAGPRRLVGPGLTTFGVAYDDPAVTPPDRLRYDACLAIDREIAGDGEIGTQTVGGGSYAVTRHVGPYERLGDTYARLCGEWLPGSGRELRSAPALEFYRNAPMNTPPEDLITDIYMPLED